MTQTKLSPMKPGRFSFSHGARLGFMATLFNKILSKEGLSNVLKDGKYFFKSSGGGWFSGSKHEYHHDFRTRQDAQSAIFDYIECFYNRNRLHQTLNYQTPVEYETMQAVA